MVLDSSLDKEEDGPDYLWHDATLQTETFHLLPRAPFNPITNLRLYTVCWIAFTVFQMHLSFIIWNCVDRFWTILKHHRYTFVLLVAEGVQNSIADIAQ